MKIEIKDLNHTYPNGVVALKKINLVIEGQSSIAIIGQNGAGKTTLVKHLNGILLPTAGDVLIDNVSTRTQSIARWSRRIGYIFQNPDDQLFQNSVRKELEFGPKRLGLDKEQIEKEIQYSSEISGLAKVLDSHPYDLPPTQKKMVAIASIIAMDPEVLVLDEPTMGQDMRGNQLLAELINKLLEAGKTLITISHDMKFVASYFDRVIVLCKGDVILDGTTREAFGQPDILALTYVAPPPMTRLAQRIRYEKTVLNINEFVQETESKIRSNIH